jgi:adenylate kinase
MLRAQVAAGTELGGRAKGYMSAGELVPDEVILGMIRVRISEQDAREGFLLDGFPRNASQADALTAALAESERRLTAALLIDVPDEEVVRRLGGRRVCAKSGHVYHVEFDPPKREGICDQDGSRLIQRDDDQEETIRRRLEVYARQTAPLIEYYEEAGLLRRFDGTRTPEEVHDHIRATVATLRLEDEL